MKEKKMAYKEMLKIEQEEGRIHKGKRIIKKKGKVVMIKNPKKKDEDLKEVIDGEVALGEIVNMIEKYSKAPKKQFVNMVEKGDNPHPHDLIKQFYKHYNDNNAYIELNHNDPKIAEHAIKYTNLLDRFDKAIKGKIKMARFGLNEVEGKGLGKVIKGTIGTLKSLFL